MSERDLYVEKAKARIDQWDAEIKKLRAKAGEAEADARIEYQNRLTEMRAERDKAEQKLKQMRQAGDEALADLKSGFDRAMDSLSKAFDDARARFK